MKKIVLFALIFAFGSSALAYGNLGLYREDYLAVSMRGRYGLSVQFQSYRPAENGFNARDTISAGALRYWNTNHSSLDLQYGNWKHKWTDAGGGTATINPFLLGVKFYNNSNNNIKFYYGAGLGSYRFEWDREVNVANGDYTSTNMGFYLDAGLEYYMTESFTANIEMKYYGCDMKNARPVSINNVAVSNRNVDISDLAIGGGLTVYF